MFDYHNDIDLLGKLESTELQLSFYSRIKGKHMYKYDLKDHEFVQLESIITIVTYHTMLGMIHTN